MSVADKPRKLLRSEPVGRVLAKVSRRRPPSDLERAILAQLEQQLAARQEKTRAAEPKLLMAPDVWRRLESYPHWGINE